MNLPFRMNFYPAFGTSGLFVRGHQFYRRSVHYGIQSNTDLFSVISAAAALLRSGVRSRDACALAHIILIYFFNESKWVGFSDGANWETLAE